MDNINKLEADWTSNGDGFVIVAHEGEAADENRVALLLDEAAVEQLRTALARPYINRQGF